MCPPPEQSLNVLLLVALPCSCLGQMALKQLIFKRGFYCQISKLFTSRRQSAAFPRAAAAAIQMDIHTCLLANSLPSCHRHVTWWHSPKHKLTPQRPTPGGGFQAQKTSLSAARIRWKLKCKFKGRFKRKVHGDRRHIEDGNCCVRSEQTRILSLMPSTAIFREA